MKSIWERNSLGYAPPQTKMAAHRFAKGLLTDFAKEYLNLDPSMFEVRSSMGGIAASGEVTLHTDVLPNGTKAIYVQISQSSLGHSIMFRSCDDRKDYCGHTNNWGSIESLLSDKKSMKTFSNRIRFICGVDE